MSHRVITISREYAAYGRTVAAALSKELGIEYYDKDFVKKTAEESGFDVELVEKEGESLSHATKNWIPVILRRAMTFSTRSAKRSSNFPRSRASSSAAARTWSCGKPGSRRLTFTSTLPRKTARPGRRSS